MDKYGIKLFENIAELLWDCRKKDPYNCCTTWMLPTKLYDKLTPVGEDQISCALEELSTKRVTKAQFTRRLRQYLFHLSK